MKKRMVKYTGYDVKARKKNVEILNPKAVQMKKTGMWAVTGKSAETGVTMYRIVGQKKPTF